MNPDFTTLLSASAEDRRDAFLRAGNNLGGAPEQNIEKDFWVSWTLDALFNSAKPGDPRLLFKGGTSLSKAYGLITRFSEDIDITIFRDDLGESASIEELEALSGNQRRKRLDAIKAAAQARVNGAMREKIADQLKAALETAGLDPATGRVELDPDDQDKQSLLIWYPKVTAAGDGYIRPAVKIESGAKSALDPNQLAIILPYVDDILPDFDLSVPNVTTVVAGRSFWDKVVILHGLRQWYERRGCYAAAASVYRAITMISIDCLIPNRAAPPRRISILAPIVYAMPGCSSTALISIWTWRRLALSRCRRTRRWPKL